MTHEAFIALLITSGVCIGFVLLVLLTVWVSNKMFPVNETWPFDFPPPPKGSNVVAKGFVIKDQEGTPLMWTWGNSEKESIDHFEYEQSWDIHKENGYTCVPVEVKEVK